MGQWARSWKREFDLSRSFLQVVASEERGHELARLNLPPGTIYKILHLDGSIAWFYECTGDVTGFST
jgi:hypothetical protein